MFAIDTNIVVRVLRRDDAEQAARAIRLVSHEDVLLLATVVLEAEWVLRSGYKLPKARVIEGLRAFAALERVTVQEPHRLALAFRWALGGLDLADAYHLAGAEACEGFVSFDRAMIRSAAAQGRAVREP